ncbi:MAG: hypothetical protein IPM21_13030 [Acidobacteria bacterium]|nr:hypothetical protein [Acidobacteriota bacterium]
MRPVIITLVIVVLFCTSGFAQTVEQIETMLVGYRLELQKVSNYGGSRDYDAQSELNKKLRESLLKFGTRPDVLDHPFPKLSDLMFVTTSKDGRLRTYSWDTESGGSMHDFITVYQYRTRDGKVNVWAAPLSDDISEFGAGSFVHQIFQTETKKGSLYLVISTFIGSTSLAAQTLDVVRIDGGQLNKEVRVIRTQSGLKGSVGFEYDFFSVVDRPERPIKLFEFNEARKEFRFPVVIEDEETRQGRVTNRFITYRFNGRYFVKLK